MATIRPKKIKVSGKFVYELLRYEFKQGRLQGHELNMFLDMRLTKKKTGEYPNDFVEEYRGV